MQNYEYLGKPFQISRLTIKNRFCMAPIGGGQHHLPEGGLKDETIQDPHKVRLVCLDSIVS